MKKKIVNFLLVLFMLTSCDESKYKVDSNVMIIEDLKEGYTILINEKFYEDFPNVALVREDDGEIYVNFQVCNEQSKEQEIITSNLTRLVIMKYDRYREMYNDHRNHTLDGILPMGICQNNDYILVWFGELSLPQENEDLMKSSVSDIYNDTMNRFNNYFYDNDRLEAWKDYLKDIDEPWFDDSVYDKNLWFSEYFSFK